MVPRAGPLGKSLVASKVLRPVLLSSAMPMGTVHGHTAQFQPLPVRHVKLAVGSCLTLVEYYWETHEWRKSQGLLK
jgi:hypothetical protein